MLFCCSQLDGKRGDDEATKGNVVLIRLGADEAFVRFGSITFGQLVVLDIPILPVSKAFRVGHLELALLCRLGKSTDNRFAVFRDRAFVRMTIRVRVSTSVASAHNDAFVTG